MDSDNPVNSFEIKKIKILNVSIILQNFEKKSKTKKNEKIHMDSKLKKIQKRKKKFI